MPQSLFTREDLDRALRLTDERLVPGHLSPGLTALFSGLRIAPRAGNLPRRMLPDEAERLNAWIISKAGILPRASGKFARPIARDRVALPMPEIEPV